MAQTFTFEQEDGSSLGSVARLDTMVSVIDAAAFLRDFKSTDDLKARQLELGEDDERNIADLLLDQVEFADVLVINKADLVSDGEMQQLKGLLAKLNPRPNKSSPIMGKSPSTVSWGPVYLIWKKPNKARAGSKNF